ncbi:MAG: hypothetical protein M3R70_10705 [Actinomycetota bacterium]|nr:hypothetical protein [Actinomycetota bacterium]
MSHEAVDGAHSALGVQRVKGLSKIDARSLQSHDELGGFRVVYHPTLQLRKPFQRLARALRRAKEGFLGALSGEIRLLTFSAAVGFAAFISRAPCGFDLGNHLLEERGDDLRNLYLYGLKGDQPAEAPWDRLSNRSEHGAILEPPLESPAALTG